ncbi:MAG: hypothetical protein A3G84_04975 [Chloroflexi bacterium RIFCSPLOWO2_12_FULL_71_12]|nr:MAG: hypothetical protein A3G84_04975 [Chloroflexi bacterium RIFCSPLOWO2_12_FULL_71_12]
MLLLGRSGGGKSTLLLGIAGLLERGLATEREGGLTVGGTPADGTDVGVLFQDPESQLVMARAGDEVAFGLEERCVPSDAIWPRADEALAAVGFPYPRDHPTSALSGGEKQRLALAGVLALQPRILLLDEPTANLDPDGARALYAVLRRLDRSTTVLLVEHHLGLALELVDRIVALDGERGVVIDGPAASVLRDHRATLESLGAWLPDAVPVPPIAAGPAGGTPVLSAQGIGFRYPLAARDALAAPGRAPTTADRRSARASTPRARRGRSAAGRADARRERRRDRSDRWWPRPVRPRARWPRGAAPRRCRRARWRLVTR